MRHAVLPYGTDRDFLAGAVSYLADGLARGAEVTAVAGPGHLDLLRREFGDDVTLRDAAKFYEHPARTLARCVREVRSLETEGKCLWLLAEPVWKDRTPLEIVEWQRIEAIANIAFAGHTGSILCPYDVAALPPDILDGARRTHPFTAPAGRGDERENTAYMDPWAYASEIDRLPLPPPPAGAEELPIDGADLYWMRAFVREYGRNAALDGWDLQCLLMSVTEVTANALRHGEPPYTLRLWKEPGDLVCEVSDGGDWRPSPGQAGLVPPPLAPGRFGLWAVRLLCSAVQVRTGMAGTTVRLRLPSEPRQVEEAVA